MANIERPDLDEILGGSVAAKIELRFVDPDRVLPMKDQPRTYIDEDDPDGIPSLGRSIREIGQLEPAVAVREGKKFRLHSGERRWRACKKERLPLLVMVVPELPDEDQKYLIAAIHNIFRRNYDPLNKARIFDRVCNGPLGLTLEEAARAFGCSPTTVRNHLLLVERLDHRVQKLMDPGKRKGKPVLRHSHALLTVPFSGHPDQQYGLALSFVNEGLRLDSARLRARRLAKKLGISESRGRERNPSDTREVLLNMLRRLEFGMTQFAEMSQAEIDALFARAEGVHYDVVKNVEERISELRGFLAKLRKFRKC